MPRRKHDAAFAFRRPLSSCFSFSPSPFSLHSLPRFPASGGNENPENVACTASVSADARDSRSFEARVIPFLLSLSSSRLLLSFSLVLHEFAQSGSLIPVFNMVFAFIRTGNARDNEERRLNDLPGSH